MRIITGDRKTYFPQVHSVRYNRKANVTVLDVIRDFDFMRKNKNHSRTLSFTAVFDPLTASLFDKSLLSKSPVRIFDLFSAQLYIDVLIVEAEMQRSFVNNHNTVSFTLSCVEHSLPHDISPPALSAISNILTVKDFILRAQQLNIPARIANLSHNLLLSPLFALMNQTVIMQNLLFSPMEAARLREINERTFADGIDLLFDVWQKLPSRASRIANAASKEERELLLNAFTPNIPQNIEAQLETDEERRLFLSSCICTLYNCANIIFRLPYNAMRVDELLKLQDELYSRYTILTNIETGVFIPEEIDNPSDFLLRSIAKIEEQLLLAQQKRFFTVEKFTDIIPLISRLYPSVTGDAFEQNFNNFIADNNIAGDLLFGLPAGKEVIYYV